MEIIPFFIFALKLMGLFYMSYFFRVEKIIKLMSEPNWPESIIRWAWRSGRNHSIIQQFREFLCDLLKVYQLIDGN